MAPRITIIGGGSFQWVPKLVVDVANTPSLHGVELALCDIDAAPLPKMAHFVEHVARVRGISLTVRTTTDQRDALRGADYVVVNISTGGFASMRHDLEIPERHGIRQSVGDTVGPGGIVRALRNIPVLVGIARDMEECCPDAWLLNLTNPMTTLCRAVNRATDIKTVGLCHEVTNTRFTLSMLLDAHFSDIGLEVTGVNHLPLVTKLAVKGDDGFALLRDLVDHAEARGQETVWLDLPEHSEYRKMMEGYEWTKGALLDANRLKLELFRRFGALPGAGDRHLAEFFPWFLTQESGWGARWGVELTTIEDRERDQHGHLERLEAMLASDEISDQPSGEMVAPLIDSVLRDERRHLPLNLPNAGQCPDLPAHAVVESMCVVDGSGPRGGAAATAPAGLAEQLRRVAASQELTVEAGLTGSRAKAFEAMLTDPLASRTDFEELSTMTDEMIDATKPWLPQFE